MNLADFLAQYGPAPKVRAAGASSSRRSASNRVLAGERAPLRSRRRGSRAALTVESWDGEYGRFHVTRREKGTLAVRDVLASTQPPYHGVRAWHGDGEDRYFGSYSEADWNDFLSDIRRNGIRNPILIRVMPRQSRWATAMPELREGNHRLQAAIQLGMEEVPVVIDYYGRAEEETRVAPETPRTPHA